MPSVTRNEFGEDGFALLELCERVHGGNTGSYQYLSVVQQMNDVLVLAHALENWEPSTHDKAQEYDNAVKLLIEATLKEYDNA
jgi:hypothetical protein